jgi:preprotein translocase subunit SecY
MFRVADLRNKILFTLAMMAIYRFGSYVPAPGIDVDAVEQLRDQASQSGGVLGWLQLFSGGALTNFAVFALGIMPYITSSIIMQILTVVIPKLEEWQNQGAVGQRKMTQWTRYLTMAIAVLQATALSFLFHNGGGGLLGGPQNPTNIDVLPDFTPARVMLVVLVLGSGTALLMWLGELITQRGIGNGMSLLIFASVVSGIPGQFAQIKAEKGWGLLIPLIALFIVVLVGIVIVENGQRRIPVQFAKRVVGRRMYGGQSTYIPLKVNQSGVIPIIFASSVLYLPLLVTQILPSGEGSWGVKAQNWINDNLVQPNSPFYIVTYGLLIIGFAYFYTAIAFDPHKQADTIRKQGGFIPGIRPGIQTERYLSKLLSRITLPGALFIAAIALLPSLLLAVADVQAFAFGGTSILIAVGELVPDDVMIGIVEERLDKGDTTQRGYILDGFPRTTDQAEALAKITSARPLDVVIDLDVPEDVVLTRLASRRVCNDCGANYSTDTPPKYGWVCDNCGGDVVQREDDTSDAIRRRLAEYAAKTAPLIDWYKDRQLLEVVDGLGAPDEVSRRLVEVVEAYRQN